jgi:hypothetical protein
LVDHVMHTSPSCHTYLGRIDSDPPHHDLLLAAHCRTDLFKEYVAALVENAADLAEASRSSSPTPLYLDPGARTSPSAATAGGGTAAPPGLSVLGGIASTEQQLQQQQDLRDQLGSLMSTASLDLAGSTAEEEGLTPEDLAQLQLIRWEQARLRAEYEKMEAKLREMETRMLGGGGSGRASPVGGPPVTPVPQRTSPRPPSGLGNGSGGVGSGNGSVSKDGGYGAGAAERDELQHEVRAKSPVLELDTETRKQMEEATQQSMDGETVVFKFWK